MHFVRGRRLSDLYALAPYRVCALPHSKTRLLRYEAADCTSTELASTDEPPGGESLMPSSVRRRPQSPRRLGSLAHRRRPSPIEAAVSQPAEFVEVPETVAPASQGIVAAPTPGVEQPVTTDNSAEEVDKPARAPRATRPRRAKAAPKGGSRRSTREDEKVANVAPSEEPTVAAQAPFEEPNAAEIASAGEASATEPAPLDDGSVTKLTPPEDAQAAAPWRPDETSPVPLRPLFEPEPFVRQQRAAFGRKA